MGGVGCVTESLRTIALVLDRADFASLLVSCKVKSLSIATFAYPAVSQTCGLFLPKKLALLKFKF